MKREREAEEGQKKDEEAEGHESLPAQPRGRTLQVYTRASWLWMFERGSRCLRYLDVYKRVGREGSEDGRLCLH